MNIAPINFNNNYRNTSFQTKHKKQATAPIKTDRCTKMAGFDSVRSDITQQASKVYKHIINDIIFPFARARDLKQIGPYDSIAINYRKSSSTSDGVAILNGGKDYVLLKDCKILSDDNFEAKEAVEHSKAGYSYYKGEISYKDNVLNLAKGENWKFDKEGNLTEQKYVM